MKTIAIPIFSGVEGKNILRTDIYRTLAGDERLKIVFLVKKEWYREYYQKEINHPRTFFEVVPPYERSFLEGFFKRLKFYLLRSKTVDLHRKTRYEETHNALRYWASIFANRLLARRWVRKIVRRLDYALVRRQAIIELYKKIKPDLIFLADLFDDQEITLLREAKRLKIMAVGMINTWDRITTRWMIRLLPDKYIAFNEIIKKELFDHDDVPLEDIYISGTVQHDHFINSKPSSRDDFYKKMGIPAGHKIILYAPLGRAFDRTRMELDQNVIKILSGLIESNSFGTKNLTLLVRFHPNDIVKEEDMPPLPGVVYDQPGIKFQRNLSDAVFARTRGQNWDMDAEELSHLHDSLHHASVVICYYTSLSIDAAFLDRPVININFDVKNGKISAMPHPYYCSEHYQKAWASGGIKLVGNLDGLSDAIKNYLENPALDRERRKKLSESQCWKIDGKSGERVAKFLTSCLETKHP